MKPKTKKINAWAKVFSDNSTGILEDEGVYAIFCSYVDARHYEGSKLTKVVPVEIIIKQN